MAGLLRRREVKKLFYVLAFGDATRRYGQVPGLCRLMSQRTKPCGRDQQGGATEEFQSDEE